MTFKLMVTGREGQIARSLAERAVGVELTCLSSMQLDLADPDSIKDAVAAFRPSLIINAGAYTAVDRAESESGRAMVINGIGPGLLASAAARIGAPIIHLSTDYVFDGRSDRPYREDDPTAPLSEYGRSKLAGEKAIIASAATSIIVRTAWVYSPFGRNFVKTMLQLATDRDEIAVVADQTGNPSSAFDVADAILSVAKRWQIGLRDGWNDIYHVCGQGSASWASLARATFAASRRLGGPTANVRDIRATDYPTAAQRPLNARLDNGKLAATFGHNMPDWKNALDVVVSRLLQSFEMPRKHG